ncbi:hypothetical protein TVAG_062010 [Trichomonas vaginalis G3]|uniref:Uncharacterized protein n=1 Tax=Trichomonas vaginalis (strain ATCC PRA-98 / G3) TaxID=412133 RepID=A2E7W6_TRIV3|nr:regulator of cytokinesis 1 PRC1-related family [Trichomonas vaginalis G3]EAY11297.1 hypothetical protein TVAG_062010 [Trichomonas vaginalis G3]KAI5526661.1 regulator of cytokinesis 1 PRC1-related family [Trichomonas vaginalis G3]|eukprot:XP_001323520.1 hypothetical protein [Trichomonas vaginalis G3]
MSEFIDDEIIAVPTELKTVWDDLGITNEEQENAIHELNQAIIAAKLQYLEQIKIRRDNILESINLRRQTLFTIIQAIPHSEEELEQIKQIGSKGTLRERSVDLDKAAEKYKLEYERASAKFIDIKNQTDRLYDRLGYTISDRGEFAEIGYVDLSDDRLARFKKELELLEQETKNRVDLLDRNEEKIREILDELDEPTNPQIQEIFDKKIITQEAFGAMGRYFDEIQAKRHAHSSTYSGLALTLTNLWELLEIPEEERNKFIATHNKLSKQSLQGCYEEIQKLSASKLEQLPQLIQRSYSRIDAALNILYRTPAEKEILLHPVKNCTTDIDRFNKLEEISARLQRELVIAAPALAMIDQRSSIIKNFNEFKDLQNVQNQKQLPKDDLIQNNIKIDKAQRRHKFVLPRLEKKLLLSLIEFRQAMGYDLTYDGEIYASKLQVELSHDEIKKAKMGGRRQSTAVVKKQLDGILDNRQRRKTEWPVALLE